MNLIIGLGNPGPRYVLTRHNIGFQSIDTLSSKYQIRLSRIDSLSQWGRGVINGKEVVLAKPQTYMNLSGKSVLALISCLHLSWRDLLIIHDDLDLPLGRLRIREKGGSGGHRGLESIIECLGTSSFTRLRIGIGRPLGQQESKDYVLEKFTQEELAMTAKITETMAQCVETILIEGTLSAMNKFNGLSIIR